MVNVRKLAAIDLHFLGAKVILAEFGLGVVGPFALGVISVRQGFHRYHSLPVLLFGAYLILLGINYVPLLLHAVDLVREGSVQQEIGDELGNRQAALRKYRRGSLLLLVPLVVPVVAIAQQAQRRNIRA